MLPLYDTLDDSGLSLALSVSLTVGLSLFPQCAQVGLIPVVLVALLILCKQSCKAAKRDSSVKKEYNSKGKVCCAVVEERKYHEQHVTSKTKQIMERSDIASSKARRVQ